MDINREIERMRNEEKCGPITRSSSFQESLVDYDTPEEEILIDGTNASIGDVEMLRTNLGEYYAGATSIINKLIHREPLDTCENMRLKTLCTNLSERNLRWFVSFILKTSLPKYEKIIENFEGSPHDLILIVNHGYRLKDEDLGKCLECLMERYEEISSKLQGDALDRFSKFSKSEQASFLYEIIEDNKGLIEEDYYVNNNPYEDFI